MLSSGAVTVVAGSARRHEEAEGEMAPIKVAGVDGCRGGWVVVVSTADGDGSGNATTTVERVDDLSSLLSRLDSGELAAVGIDIPIGLPETPPRRCDVEARRMIGARRSSVFPAPVRGLLGAANYEEAAARCRERSGTGISRQAFGILPKIDEIDRLITPERQHHLVEVHPEVSFTALAGTPMAHYKRTGEGHTERLRALSGVFPDVEVHAATRVAGTSPDDVLDAFAVAWTARRWSAGIHIRLGGAKDERGLRMEIIA
jgi:predicted RNase H-like nuclease